MTTSPSSGLSPEAKEFVPLVQNPPPSIPLYVDENTVASIYPSDQQPLMLQTIYPMMISNSKVQDNLQFPEIEFHIQPSQQQQFHIDSCANLQQSSSLNGNASTTTTSQIVLLPAGNPIATGTSISYYPAPQLIYSTNESIPGCYPVDYCDPPLINFSLQHPTHLTKSSRISSQTRPSSFRQQHGTNHSTYRPPSRGGGNTMNRNPYYDYNNRRNGSSYMANSGRGNSLNSKRISSSYHHHQQQHDYNHYNHPSSSTRSRGYAPRASHDDYRKDHFDHYNHEKDFYENDYQQAGQLNDDGTLFEFRPEDFPSLPMNNPQSDKTSSQSDASPNIKPSASSWNAIVSATRPRSTSPHSIPSSQEQRSDRSRSFNNKLSSHNDRKTSNRKLPSQSLAVPKSPAHASKSSSQDEQPRSQSLTNSDSPIIESNLEVDDSRDDGFIQTKQQHRRLKRKNKLKDEPIPLIDLAESAPYALDDENAFPTLGQPTTPKKSENEEQLSKSSPTHQISVKDMLESLETSSSAKQSNSHSHPSAISVDNSVDLKRGKERKPTRMKRLIKKEFEENRSETISKSTVEGQSNQRDTQNETDTNTPEEVHPNPTRLSSNSSNSSDTSDYDDAVDNLDDE